MSRYDELAELRRDWKAPAELRTATPREVHLSGGGVAVAILGVAMLAGAVACFVALQAAADRQNAEQRLLRDQGADVVGEITRLWRSGSGNDARNMVGYHFTWDGREYQGSLKVRRQAWNRLAEGSPFPVRLVPSNPAIHQPRDFPNSGMPRWVPPLAALTLAGTGVLLLFLLRRESRMLAEGRPAPAVVTRHSRADHGQKVAHYEFPLLNGAVARGKCSPARKPRPIGASLCVLYDGDNPRRNRPYPMSLVKVAPRF